MKLPDTDKLIQISKWMFWLNTAVWLTFGIWSIVRIGNGAPGGVMTLWIIAILMLGNVAAFLWCSWAVQKQASWYRFTIITVLAANILLTRLPSERQLAQDLGVARNTVRDALEGLEERGLIRRRAGSGSFVTYDPHGKSVSLAPVASETGPLQLQVVRGIIEPEMVRLAIISMPPRAIEALGETLSCMEGVMTDAAAFVRLEEEFHRQIAAGTGNPLLIACYNLVIDARRQSFRAAMSPPPDAEPDRRLSARL